MPRKKTLAAATEAALPSLPKEWLDTLVTGPMTAETIHDLSLAFKKALIERALDAELNHYLGYGPGEAKPEGQSNHRNGATGKTVLTETGPHPALGMHCARAPAGNPSECHRLGRRSGRHGQTAGKP